MKAVRVSYDKKNTLLKDEIKNLLEKKNDSLKAFSRYKIISWFAHLFRRHAIVAYCSCIVLISVGILLAVLAATVIIMYPISLLFGWI